MHTQSGTELYQKLQKAAKIHEEIIAKEVASWLEASCRAITSPTFTTALLWEQGALICMVRYSNHLQLSEGTKLYCVY